MLLRALRNLKLRCMLSLRTGCIITSSFFVEDGLVKVMDSLLGFFSPPGGRQVWWELFDGILLLCLGMTCVLGLEKGTLNLIRWPTLCIFIFKVVEYVIDHVIEHRRKLGDMTPAYVIRKSKEDGTTGLNHLDWISHFLLPSIHLGTVALFLWRNWPSGQVVHPVVVFNRNRGGGNCGGQMQDQVRLLDFGGSHASLLGGQEE